MKNIIILLLLFSGAIQAQGITILGGDLTTPSLDISVTKYSDNWSQWSIPSHSSPSHTPSCISSTVTISTNFNFKTGSANPLTSAGTFDFTTSYKYIGINNIVLETATTHPIYYHFVSDQDYDDFEDDLAYNPSDGSHLSPNGEIWLDVCVTDLTPQAFLEAQSNFDRSRGSVYFFGDATNTYISIVSDSSFRVSIGTSPYLVFESYTSVNDAYARLQDLLALHSWERDIIGLGFTPVTGSNLYQWERTCNNENIRVGSYPGDRVRIRRASATVVEPTSNIATRVAEYCN